MHKDTRILGAMLRLARKREAARIEALVDRVGGTRAEVRSALRLLEAQGLVERLDADAARLTFVGFAIAVATRSAAKSLAAPARQPQTVRARRIRAA